MSDYAVTDHGSIVILTPLSEEGCEWCEQHLSDAPRWGDGYAIEPRYMRDLIEWAWNDGLVFGGHL